MIPFLLNKTKSLPTLVSDTTAGIGEITGAYDGVAVEEGNGIKELSFKLPIDSPRYSQISVGSYIKAKADEYHGLQIYEIYRITKPINGIVTIYAQHISYMLGKATVKPFEATGITQVTQKMIQNLIGTFPFTFSSDIVNTQSSFKLDVPMSFRKAIGGWRGSILDVFGGELDWDNLDVYLKAHRGQDRGVRVEYGKNLTSLTQEESIANVYDAVVGYAIINEVTYVGDIQKITTTDSPRTQNVDFSGSFSSDEQLTPEQIKTRLNSLALAYAQNNDIGKPKVNLRISFEPLSKFEEYKDIALLEQTGLFDTVYVLFPKLGVEAKAKIIRTEYDFINEKMLSVELGDAKTNLLGLVDEQIESQISDMDIDVSGIEEAIGFLDEYVENLSQIITNGLGLFFTKVQLVGGGYQYFLHDEPQLSNSMNQWTINAGGFALSTDGGQTWTAGIDAQGNAVLNSLSTIVLKALQIYGSFLRFGDVNTNYIDVAPYSVNDVSQGVSFDGSGSVRFQPQNEFIVRNTDSNNSLYNYLYMHHDNSGNSFNLENRYYNGTTNIANSVSMQSNSSGNIMYVMNKKQGASTNANYIQFTANSTNDVLTLNNLNLGANSNANTIAMGSYNGGYNTATMSNNYYSASDTANRVQLYATSANASIDIENGRWTSGSSSYVTNYISMQKTSTASKIYMRNRLPSQNYDANHLLMFFENGQSSVELSNYNSSGGEMNYLKFNVNGDGIAILYADSDLRLSSGGAVRIQSGYGQDVTIYGADDVSITYNDKFHIIQGSTDRVISFGSDGNVKWSNA